MHLVVYIKDSDNSLNKIVAESKRFLAYEIVKRLKKRNKLETLKELESAVQANERVKGKRHQVFRLSFDAKALDEKEVESVLDYIHQNPVSGKWNLVKDYTDYPYSSAGYYEIGIDPEYEICDYRNVNSESSASDSEE